jgi:RNA polymerase sigma-70 factor, ECF subfamily
VQNLSHLESASDIGVNFTAAVPKDAVALNLLFVSCIPRLRSTALRLMNNKEDSEDALQDALLQAFRHIHTFQGRAKFSTWMHSILVNSVRSMRRRQRSELILSSLEEGIAEEQESLMYPWHCDHSATPEEACFEDEVDRIFAEILEKLPPTHRQALWLREVQGCPITEVAARLGIGVGAAKARVYRARCLLRSTAPNGDVSGLCKRTQRRRSARIRRRYPEARTNRRTAWTANDASSTEWHAQCSRRAQQA